MRPAHHPHSPPAPPAIPGAEPPASPPRYHTCTTDNCNPSVILGVGCFVLLAALLMQQFVRALHRRNMRMVTETTALMLLGVLAEAIYFARATADGRPVWQATSLARSEDVHDLIIFALLPPIIFEAGFTMRKRKFFANFVSVMLFAVLGTLAAIIVTGGFLYLMVQAGAVEEVAPLHIPPHPKPPRVDDTYYLTSSGQGIMAKKFE